MENKALQEAAQTVLEKAKIVLEATSQEQRTQLQGALDELGFGEDSGETLGSIAEAAIADIHRGIKPLAESEALKLLAQGKMPDREKMQALWELVGNKNAESESIPSRVEALLYPTTPPAGAYCPPMATVNDVRMVVLERSFGADPARKDQMGAAIAPAHKVNTAGSELSSASFTLAAELNKTTLVDEIIKGQRDIAKRGLE